MAAAIAALIACAAHAGIVDQPASIVDHGSYVTDTVNHLDWYKFSNAQSTVGLSFNAAQAQFSPLGWNVGSELQVQLLESQFGWVDDTPSVGLNANYGLTYAMGDLIGYTSTFSQDGAFFSTTETRNIEALTTDVGFLLGDPKLYQLTTFSQTIREKHLHGSTKFTGDFVEVLHAFMASDATDAGIGTWLVRDSAIPPVPEPETYALLSLGLFGMYVGRRRLR